MKRRGFVQALVGAPALPALLDGQTSQQTQPPAQTQAPGAPVNPAQPVQPPPRAAEDLPRLTPSVADTAGTMMPKFFNAQQFAALRKLSDLLVPPLNGAPGALDAGVPEFLDFLVGASLADRQEVYRIGLDALNAQAKKRYSKPFADVDVAEAAALLAPLKEKWTYDTPANPVSRFLRVAKQDVRTATANSKENSTASMVAGRRGGGGGGIYWYPLD